MWFRQCDLQRRGQGTRALRGRDRNAVGKWLFRGVSTVMTRLQTIAHNRVAANGGFRGHGSTGHNSTVRRGLSLPRRTADYVDGVGPVRLGLRGCATPPCSRPKHMAVAPGLPREQLPRGISEISAVFWGVIHSLNYLVGRKNDPT